QGPRPYNQQQNPVGPNGPMQTQHPNQPQGYYPGGGNNMNIGHDSSVIQRQPNYFHLHQPQLQQQHPNLQDQQSTLQNSQNQEIGIDNRQGSHHIHQNGPNRSSLSFSGSINRPLKPKSRFHHDIDIPDSFS